MKQLSNGRDTRYRTAKQMPPLYCADSSLRGAYQWCSHLATTSEVVPMMASLPFWRLPVAVQWV